MIWWPHLKTMTCAPGYKLLFFIYHIIPAYIANIILRFHGSKLNVVNIYRKIYLQIGSYEYFMSKNFTFPYQKMQTVYSRMSNPDQIFFPTQIFSHDAVHQYITDDFNGLKKYILKETDQEISNISSRRIKVLKLVYYTIWSIIYFFSAYYFLSILQRFFGNVLNIHHQLRN